MSTPWLCGRCMSLLLPTLSYCQSDAKPLSIVRWQYTTCFIIVFARRKSNHFWMWSGYISMPNRRPCVLHKMNKTSKFDQFLWVKIVPNSWKINRHWPNLSYFWKWSGYISIVNVRPSKFCPFRQFAIVPKVRKSTSCNHNRIVSINDQDTTAFRISGHFFNLQCVLHWTPENF